MATNHPRHVHRSPAATLETMASAVAVLFCIYIVLGQFVFTAFRSVHGALHRWYRRHREIRLARARYNTLRELDDRTLRDVGFHRSELLSLATRFPAAADRIRRGAERTGRPPM